MIIFTIFISSFALGAITYRYFNYPVHVESISDYEFVVSTGIIVMQNGPSVQYKNITVAYYGSQLGFSGDNRFSGWIIIRPTNQMGPLKGMIIHYTWYTFYVEYWDETRVWLQEIVKK